VSRALPLLAHNPRPDQGRSCSLASSLPLSSRNTSDDDGGGGGSSDGIMWGKEGEGGCVRDREKELSGYYTFWPSSLPASMLFGNQPSVVLAIRPHSYTKDRGNVVQWLRGLIDGQTRLCLPFSPRRHGSGLSTPDPSSPPGPAAPGSRACQDELQSIWPATSHHPLVAKWAALEYGAPRPTPTST
jgi:hypothetical protein